VAEFPDCRQTLIRSRCDRWSGSLSQNRPGFTDRADSARSDLGL